MPFDAPQIDAARRHLRRRDPVMRALIGAVGPFTLRVERDRFRMLVRSILSQQISMKAARSIRGRLEALLGTKRMTPDSLAALSQPQLRSAGLSSQKASYLHDLSAKVASGEVRLHRVARMSDDEVIEELTQVKGIGEWTAQMFLMFSLGRLDVFPHGDFGIRRSDETLRPPRSSRQRHKPPHRRTLASLCNDRELVLLRSHEVEKITLPRKTEFPV